MPAGLARCLESVLALSFLAMAWIWNTPRDFHVAAWSLFFFVFYLPSLSKRKLTSIGMTGLCAVHHAMRRH